jgi:hypothetical protein
MTPEEMEADLQHARELLSCTQVTVRRNEHWSVDSTVLWFFDGEMQIGSASRVAIGCAPTRHDAWLASRMLDGSPCGIRRCANLAEACAFAIAKPKVAAFH